MYGGNPPQASPGQPAEAQYRMTPVQAASLSPSPQAQQAYTPGAYQHRSNIPGPSQQFMSGTQPAYTAQGYRPSPGGYYGSTQQQAPMFTSPMRKPPERTRTTTQQMKKQCNCKNSRCLKLYCECFASGRYCEACNCVNCFNNRENEAIRQSAVEAILERNPNAFRPKIQGSEAEAVPQPVRVAAPDGAPARHTKGCNCKKSTCLKKYCECFQAGIFCSDNCKCMDCKNFEGSEARAQVLANQDNPNPASMPLTMMTGPSPVKRARLAPMAPPGTIPVMMSSMPAAQGLVQAPMGAVQHGLPTGSAPTPTSGPPAISRASLAEVVNEVVKRSIVEELCSLLIMVAQDEADKVTSEGAGPGMDQGAGDAGEQSGGGNLQGEGVTSQVYELQERAVLQEFLSILQKIMDTAQKKAATQHTPGGGEAAAHIASTAARMAMPAMAFAGAQQVSYQRSLPMPGGTTPMGMGLHRGGFPAASPAHMSTPGRPLGPSPMHLVSPAPGGPTPGGPGSS